MSLLLARDGVQPRSILATDGLPYFRALRIWPLLFLPQIQGGHQIFFRHHLRASLNLLEISYFSNG